MVEWYATPKATGSRQTLSIGRAPVEGHLETGHDQILAEGCELFEPQAPFLGGPGPAQRTTRAPRQPLPRPVGVLSCAFAFHADGSVVDHCYLCRSHAKMLTGIYYARGSLFNRPRNLPGTTGAFA